MKFILRIFFTFLSRFFPGAVNGGEGGKREAITLETSLFNDPCVASDDGSTFVKLRQSGSDTHARGCISPLFVPFCIRSSPFPACYCFQVSVASTSKSENMQRTNTRRRFPSTDSVENFNSSECKRRNFPDDNGRLTFIPRIMSVACITRRKRNERSYFFFFLLISQSRNIPTMKVFRYFYLFLLYLFTFYFNFRRSLFSGLEKKNLKYASEHVFAQMAILI